MGTFIGHFVPGLALTILGLWHIINSIRSYCLKGPSNFISKFWYPFNNSLLKLKELELILILSFSVLAIILQVLDYPAFHLSFKLDNFEHATMFIHLAIFTGFAYYAESNQISESVSSVVGIMAASVFGQELFLLHFHSTDHVGLEGQYHGLLQLIVLVSFLAAVAMTVFPTSFPAALVLSVSVVFQGCWFVNMGFMLWIPKLIPKGCFPQMDKAGSSGMMHGAVTCGSPEADFRARALANLQFSWILAGILMFTGVSSMILARKGIPRIRQLTAYEQLQNRKSESPVTIECFKQPLDH
ncbi:transmembrane protein 45A-like [Chenopodium quinoa]|uniref:Transmembrane protein 45B n=1 Tax=Chenopodium quinoa TaxID=63459 RepID=A0A803LNY0_CHEQI|nr:transmembrane protein 45A-like [Chenopodium quinoa]